MKLKHRIFITVFAVSLIAVTFIGSVALNFYSKNRSKSDSELISQMLYETASLFNSRVEEKRKDDGVLVLSCDTLKDLSVKFVEEYAYCTIILADGSVIGASGCDIGYDRENGIMTASTPIRFENGENTLYISLPFDKNAYSKLAALLFVSGLSISFATAFAGFVISSAFEKKLNKLNVDAANYVGDKNVRFPEYRQPELDRIAQSLNQAADARSEDMNKLQVIADGRKQFTDNLAHEMKTPLTSILGFADILRIRRSVDDKARMEYAAIIFEEAKRLRGLSGKLLELATAGNTRLEFKTVDVMSFFDEIRLSVLPLLAPRKITLTVTSDRVQIRVDPELFKSLIYNLIENSAKASPDGAEIRLSCKANADTIKISVSDSGCGMTKDQIRKAAEPFYMVDKSRSRKAGGVGLGLALCREIAEKHRARMLIQSTPGKGTTVTLIMLTVLNTQNKEGE